jgi:nicotinamidase-related amidase
MPRRGEVVVSAHDVSSAFGGTDLDLHLRSLDVDEIVACGLLANTCIESTVRQGVDLGYRVTVLTDAVAAWTRGPPGRAACSILSSTCASCAAFSSIGFYTRIW